MKYAVHMKKVSDIKFFVWKLKCVLLHPLRWKKQPAFEEKILPARASESALAEKENWQLFAEKLSFYDIISFDIFDTAIFRLFSDPKDVFYLVGISLCYPDFRQARIEAEQAARKEKFKLYGTYEVTLEDIWAVLEKEIGISACEGMAAELECEKKSCIANPYIRNVISKLQETGKKIIFISDMYLGQAQIKELLTSCGYSGKEECFISCEYNTSKNEGCLYQIILDTFGKNHSYIHIGDNFFSDFQKPKPYGIDSIYYENINIKGNRLRPMDMSMFSGSIYRGIVNSHLYCGLDVYSKEYEYGFLYGGLFVSGYCKFIHQYVQAKGIEKILFLSRDGYILYKAYSFLYPNDNAAYTYWSRSAALKITSSRFRREYFKRFLFHKSGQGFTIQKTLEDMELEALSDNLSDSLNLYKEEELTHKNVGLVKNYLIDTWQEVQNIYKKQSLAGKEYYTGILNDCANAAAVDIGWMGSGPIMLDYAVNSLWGLQCPITGIIAGTNSSHTFEQDAAEPFLASGKLVSYLFSQMDNRDLWKFHDPSLMHNLYWELLLGAPFGSLKHFFIDSDGKAAPRLKEPPLKVGSIREIHRGIMDFVTYFHNVEQALGIEIPVSGRDAYAPMLLILNKKNKKTINQFQDILDNAFVD